MPYNLLNPIIGNLKKNPIFSMSLGSKELFHSNFLEYLFTLDASLFIGMMNGFLPAANKLQGRFTYYLDRELKDFDICIYHEEKDNKGEVRTVYDIVLENKVKSIPYKEQLKLYANKAKGSAGCRFILLTLSKNFPDFGDPDIANWITLGYADLLNGINTFFVKSGKLSAKTMFYLSDYCSFICEMDKLGQILTPNLGQVLFDRSDILCLEKIRLHDLYIKLRSSWFAMTLKNELNNVGIPTNVVHSFKKCKYRFVNINIDMNQGNGQIAAWICDGSQVDKDGNMAANLFEVVIQGNQFRHGINQQSIGTPGKTGKERLNELFDRLGTIQDAKPLDFLFFGNQQKSVCPNKAGKHRNYPLQKSGPFDCYGDDYLYRYTVIGNNETIGILLKRMVSDIKMIWDAIPNLY